MRRHAAISAVLIAAVFAIYFQLRDHSFVKFDDPAYLARIESGLSLESVREAFTSTVLSNWIPLTWISLLVDYELYGREPAGFLLTNAAIHALNSVLLYVLFFRLTRRMWRSAFLAAIFAVHPLHVESVAWLSERKDCLSGLFWLLATLSYTRYAAVPRSRAAYAGVLVFLALGLMSKPMVVTLPFTLLLLDYWPLDRLRSNSGGALPDPARVRVAIVEKLPLFALIAAGSVAAFLIQRGAGSVPDTELIPLAARLGNALESYVAYLGSSFWPTGLHVFYPHPLAVESTGRVIFCALLLIASTLLMLGGARRWPWNAVGWLWYLGTLVPVIGLVQVGMQARADRYMYIPQIGVALIVVWTLADFVERRPKLRFGVSIAATVAIVALAVTSWRQTAHWKDTTSLWERSVSVNGENHLARRRLGNALRLEGRFAEAEAHYAEAVRLRPLDAKSHFGLAETSNRLGRFDQAVAHYEKGLALQPERSRDRLNFAWALLNAGELAAARTQFEAVEALVASGDGALTRQFQFSLHSGLAATLEQQKDLDAAIQQLEKALELRPEDAQAHLRLASLALRTGRHELARVHLEEVVALGGATPDVNRALSKLRRHQSREAR